MIRSKTRIESHAMVKETIKTISESTPISIALMIALCGGAYWTGVQSNRLTSVESSTAAVQELTVKTSELAADNKRRLDYQTIDFVRRLDRIENILAPKDLP